MIFKIILILHVLPCSSNDCSDFKTYSHCRVLKGLVTFICFGSRINFVQMETSKIEEKAVRPQFGNRFLQKGDNDEVVFQHNAW